MTMQPEVAVKATTLRDTGYQISWLHAWRRVGGNKDAYSRALATHVEQHPDDRWTRKNKNGVRTGRTHAGRLLGEVRDRGDVAPTPLEFNIAFALAGCEGQLDVALELEGEQRMPKVVPIPSSNQARLELHDLFTEFADGLRAGGDIEEAGADLASFILGLVAGQKESI